MSIIEMYYVENTFTCNMLVILFVLLFIFLTMAPKLFSIHFFDYTPRNKKIRIYLLKSFATYELEQIHKIKLEN